MIDTRTTLEKTRDELKANLRDLENEQEELARKEKTNKLTWDEAPSNHYLMIVSGDHRGKIVIKPYKYAMVNDECVTYFAATLTPIRVSEIEHTIVRRAKWGQDEIEVDDETK